MLGRHLKSLFFMTTRKSLFFQSNGLFKILGPCTVNQQASITGKASRKDRPPRPPPFDYINKKYRYWHVLTDPMHKRFDDNSKIVVVEGLPTSGKDKFARQLADELEMHYMPQPKFDDLLIDEYGFDYRTLNSQLPIDVQYYDERMFLENPTGRNTVAIQHTFLQLRYRQYLTALTHIFSTGQGVVLQRCPWSDIVFMKAIKDCDYASLKGYDYYRSACECSLHHILRPHLVIYLDVPASVVQDRIRQRAIPHEVNSKALNIKFLSAIEKNYKDSFLPIISNHAHTLIYNWTDGGDVAFVVDDIEQLQFDNYPRENPKMGDWKFESLEDQRAARDVFANKQQQLLYHLIVRRYDVPEMLISGQDNQKRGDLIAKLQEESMKKDSIMVKIKAFFGKRNKFPDGAYPNNLLNCINAYGTLNAVKLETIE